MVKRLIIACLFGLLGGDAAMGVDLAGSFRNPPDSARPWVYWMWTDGNVAREGITADLEAMRRVGIGGVLVGDVDCSVPPGPVAFMTPPWRELFKHAVSERIASGWKST